MRWVVVMMLAVGCGASDIDRGNDTSYVVVAKRLGQSLHLKVTGFQNANRQGGPFEDPTRWRVKVSSGGTALKQVVRGSVRVTREPVPQSQQWKVSVEFSVAFAMPERTDRVKVRITAPGAPARTMKVPVRDATSTARH